MYNKTFTLTSMGAVATLPVIAPALGAIACGSGTYACYRKSRSIEEDNKTRRNDLLSKLKIVAYDVREKEPDGPLILQINDVKDNGLFDVDEQYEHTYTTSSPEVTTGLDSNGHPTRVLYPKKNTVTSLHWRNHSRFVRNPTFGKHDLVLLPGFELLDINFPVANLIRGNATKVNNHVLNTYGVNLNLNGEFDFEARYQALDGKPVYFLTDKKAGSFDASKASVSANTLTKIASKQCEVSSAGYDFGQFVLGAGFVGLSVLTGVNMFNHS